jgi:hypothetical protein
MSVKRWLGIYNSVLIAYNSSEKRIQKLLRGSDILDEAIYYGLHQPGYPWQSHERVKQENRSKAMHDPT